MHDNKKWTCRDILDYSISNRHSCLAHNFHPLAKQFWQSFCISWCVWQLKQEVLSVSRPGVQRMASTYMYNLVRTLQEICTYLYADITTLVKASKMREWKEHFQLPASWVRGVDHEIKFDIGFDEVSSSKQQVRQRLGWQWNWGVDNAQRFTQFPAFFKPRHWLACNRPCNRRRVLRVTFRPGY